MKRRIIISIFLIIFLIGVVSADWVSLNTPAEDFFAAKYVFNDVNLPQNFQCEVHLPITYSQVALFSDLNVDNSWREIQIKTKTQCPNNICTFSLGISPANYLFNVQNVPTGVYKWGCAFRISPTTDWIFSASNRTLIFTRDKDIILGSGKFENEVWGGTVNKNPLTIQQDTPFEQELKLRNSFYLIENGSALSAENLESYSVVESPHLAVLVKDIWGQPNRKIINITPESGWAGETYIIFNATKERILYPDYSGNSTKWTIIVNGTSAPANLAPVVTQQLTYLEWPKNTNRTIDNLNTYFADPDGDTLTYTATTPPQNFQIQISGSQIKFIPADNFIGTGYTSITASDGILSVSQNDILLNVTNTTNLPPVITSHFPENPFVTLEVGQSQLFSITANDPENATLKINWTLDGVQVSNSTNYTYPAQTSPKNQTLQIEVSDSIRRVVYTWVIKVIPDEGVRNQSCISDSSCQAITCTTNTCTDLCGNEYLGTKNCGGSLSQIPDKCSSDNDCNTGEICIDGRCNLKSKKSSSSLTTSLIWIAVGILAILVIVGVVFLLRTLKKNKAFKQLPISSSGPVFPR